MKKTALLTASLLVLTSCGGSDGSPDGPGTVLPTPTPTPTAPRFTSANTATTAENVAAIYQATISGGPATFAISGGADAARFAITQSGALSFVAAPDFDAPQDADGDNVYLVQVSATAAGVTDRLDLQVTVTNSREGIAVRRVGTGFARPLYVAPIPGTSHVFVLEKDGKVFDLDPANGAKTLLFTVGNLSVDNERGLLGIATQSDYQTTRKAFVVATAADGTVEVREYSTVAPFGYTVILSVPHPNANHNGGWIEWGPDGNLYVSIGDNGTGMAAQDPNSRLGKILRIARNSGAGAPYVPAPGNPYLGGGGDPYVFAIGFRNPFRASFYNNGLLIGDVGEGGVEEVDFVRLNNAGLNFGWPFKEGTRQNQANPPAGLIDPVTEYQHGTGPRQGNSITGGYVYRGPVTSLVGSYVFADFVRGHIWTVPASALLAGGVLPSSTYQRRNTDFTPDVGTINAIASFGEDAAGNLYIVDIADGEIFEVVPG